MKERYGQALWYLSLRKQLVVLSVGALFVQLVLIFLFYAPQVEVKQQLHNEQASLQAQIEDLDNQLANFDLKRKVAPPNNQKSEIGVVIAKKPPPHLLSELAQLALDNQLNIEKIEIEKKQGHLALCRLPIRMELVGSYPHLAFFLQTLPHTEYLVVTEEFVMQSRKDVDHQLHIAIKAFIYQLPDKEGFCE